MTYLITGGSGFIGTHLGLSLQQAGENFRIIDKRPSITFPERVSLLDILDADRLAQSLSGHTIFHLAAEHRDDVNPVDLYHRVNVEGTRHLCRAASLRGINRIIFTSTAAVYGFPDDVTDETGPTNPFSAYGCSKLAAEKVLRAWAAEAPQTRSLTIIRPTVVFGPGNRGNVYTLFRQIALGRFVMVGRGENRKSLAYIDNLVAFLRHMSQAEPGVHRLNYVATPALPTRELITLARHVLRNKSGIGPSIPIALGTALGHMADTFAALTGKSLPISAQRVRKFTNGSVFASRAHDHEGFVAPVTVEDGIRATLDAEFLNPKPHPIFYTQ